MRCLLSLLLLRDNIRFWYNWVISSSELYWRSHTGVIQSRWHWPKSEPNFLILLFFLEIVRSVVHFLREFISFWVLACNLKGRGLIFVVCFVMAQCKSNTLCDYSLNFFDLQDEVYNIDLVFKLFSPLLKESFILRIMLISYPTPVQKPFSTAVCSIWMERPFIIFVDCQVQIIIRVFTIINLRSTIVNLV